MSAIVASSSKSPPTFSPVSNMDSLDEFLDLSAFGGSASSRESSPLRHPQTPPHLASPFDLYQTYLGDVPLDLASKSLSPIREHSIWSFDSLPSEENIFGHLADDASLFQATSSSPSLNGLRFAPDTTTVPTFGHPSFAINPQLVATPSPIVPTLPPSPPQQEQTPREPETPMSDDEQDDDEAETAQNDDDDDDGTASVGSPPPSAAPSKAGTKGRKAASGIIQSGAISKRVTSSVVALDKDPDSDDWRPSPEEYKKLSSKEKRQLRNKISARNFRVRRKEYITTLESHIADRDRLIETIRAELGASRLENQDLRQEVEALKRAMLEGRLTAADLSLPPPAPLDAEGNLLHPPTPVNVASRKLNKPNLRKDIAPGSPRTTRGFWGGTTNPLGGNITSVHATLIPDLFPLSNDNLAPSSSPVQPLLLSEKPRIRDIEPSSYDRQQENINPLLNSVPPLWTKQTAQANHALMSRLDAFMDSHPFTIKSADDYRMHLWAQMGRDQGFRMAAQQQPQSSSAVPQFMQNSRPASNDSAANAQSSLLLNALRPAFFGASSSMQQPAPSAPTSPKSTLAALLSGKPTSSKSLSSSLPTSTPAPQPTQQQAYLAALASQTLLSKLGSAFWDAFSGSAAPASSASNTAGLRSWDADKVQRVLEGKAVVRVVDVESPINEKDGFAAIEERMRGLNLGAGATSLPHSQPTTPPATLCTGIFSGLRK